jgi:hypothetical protein
LLVVATAACGASAAGEAPIVFGIAGGNVIPYRVTIQPNGRVRVTGRKARRQIAPARVRQLRREIQRAHLASRRCAGVPPDVATQYIRLGGRRYVVHGGCEARFRHVWNDLLRTVRLRSG